MRPIEIMERTKEEITGLTNLELSGIIGYFWKEDGWHVEVELIEKKAVPDTQDLLGVYEVTLDDKGNVLGFERRRVRRRSDVESTVE